MTKWTQFKSWWYWNISSKYDTVDIFAFTAFPLMIVLFIVLAIGVHNEKKEHIAACEAQDGVLITTNRRYYCLDKNALKSYR